MSDHSDWQSDGQSDGQQGRQRAPRESLWAEISPSYLFAPDWHRAVSQRRVVPAIAALLGIGLGGAFLASLLAPIAVAAGFENTLSESLEDLSLVVQAITIVLLAPVVEEFLYRLTLRRRVHLGLLWLVSTIVSLLYLPHLAVSLPLLAGSAVFLILWATQLPSRSAQLPSGASDHSMGNRFANWWETQPRIPVYVAISAFGLAHLSNFTVDWSPAAVVVIPIAVAPQLWLGLMFTIARVRYGWLAAVILHAVHNSIIWGIASLLPE